MRVALNKFQHMLWKYASLYPEGFYNLGLSFRIAGDLDEGKLCQACDYLVRTIDGLHVVLVQSDKDYEFETHNDAVTDYRVAPGEWSLADCEKDMKSCTRETFNLFMQHPIRFKLYRLKDHTYMMLLVFHHICVDGVSMVDAYHLLARIYDSLVDTGKLPVLDDVSSLQNGLQALARPEDIALKHEAMAYWHGLLDGKSQSVRLTNYSSSDKTDFEVNYEYFALGEGRMSAVAQLAQQQGTTVFRVILSAWMLLLQRISGQETVAVDVAVNLRPAGCQNLVGFFVNNLPMVCSFRPDMTCAELIRDMTLQRRQLKEVQHFSFAEMAVWLQQEKHTSIIGNTNVGINFVSWGDAFRIPFRGLECKFYQRCDDYSAFDLLLEVDPTPKGNARMGYRPSFSSFHVSSWISSFLNILDEFVADSGRQVSHVPLLPSGQIREMTEKASRRLGGLPPVTDSVGEVFRSVALSRDARTALVYGGRRVTYGELLDLAEECAGRILYRFNSSLGGIRPGEPLGICTTDKSDAIIWMMGILFAGGSYVCFPVDYPDDRLRYLVSDYHVRAILSDLDQAGRLGSLEDVVLITPDAPCVGQPLVLPVVSPDVTAYIISTSGTTGRPKGVPVTHRQLLTLRESEVGFKDGEHVMLQYASHTFDASVWEIFMSLLNGHTLVVATEDERLSPILLSRLVERERVTLALIPPIVLQELQEEASGHTLPSLRVLCVGGDVTPSSVLLHWQAGGRRVLNLYGPTEGTVVATCCVTQEGGVANDIGTPLRTVSAYVLDEYLNLQPDYWKGELYIGGPQVTSGYLNRPGLNVEKFLPNPFATDEDRRMGRNLVLYRTGDIVSRLPDGHLLFHGRCDNQVKVHGYRIEPGEIEMVLHRHPAVVRAIVVHKPLRGDTRLAAYVQLDAGIESVDAAVLRSYLESHLPYYMVPTAWSFVTSFPLTKNGKPDLLSLPEPSWETAVDEYVPASTSEEQLLVSVVAGVCGTGRVGVTTDLFSLGVTSIQVMMIVSQTSALGLELSATSFYRYRNIRGILRHRAPSVCYWHNESADRPVAVVVCGDMYFSPDYLPLAGYLSRHYAVLVLETYHEYMSHHPLAGWDAVLDAYYSLCKDKLGGQVPHMLCGFCIGGEMALSLAARFAVKGVNPELLLIGSFAAREKSVPVTMDYPGTSEEISRRRLAEANYLVQTEELPPYKGQIQLFLADHFTTERLARDEVLYAALRRQYDRNDALWRQRYPQCTIVRLEATHWELLRAVTAFLHQNDTE